MDVFPFHYRNLFFNIITDYDLTFQEVREILDYLLEGEAFAEEKDDFADGKIYDIQLGNIRYAVDVNRYEVVIYQRTQAPLNG